MHTQDVLVLSQQGLQLLPEGREPRVTPVRAVPHSHRARATSSPRATQGQGGPGATQEQKELGPEELQHTHKGPQRRELPAASVQGTQAATRLQPSTRTAQLRQGARALG